MEEPEDILSSEEVVQLVLDAERLIESIQMDMEHVAEKDGERTETHSLHIRVGEDSYRKLDGESWPWNEVLHFSGVDYYRDEDGTWKTEDQVVDWAGGHIYAEMGRFELEGALPWNQSLVSEAYALDFNEFRDADVLDERVLDGRRVIGLSAESTTPIPEMWMEDIESQIFPSGVAIEDPDGLLEAALEDMREELAKAPDSIWHKQVIWIGVDDFRVYRVEMDGATYREGVEIGTYTITQTYSLFNQASLPGPLP